MQLLVCSSKLTKTEDYVVITNTCFDDSRLANIVSACCGNVIYDSGRGVAEGGGRGNGPPNNEKAGAQETLKPAIKSINWKIALKWQVQLLFLSRKGRIFISKKVLP